MVLQPELIMEATRPGQNEATSDREADGGVGGGAPAEEEDIGTEGAGTEPRTSVDEDRAMGSSEDDPAR